MLRHAPPTPRMASASASPLVRASATSPALGASTVGLPLVRFCLPTLFALRLRHSLALPPPPLSSKPPVEAAGIKYGVFGDWYCKMRDRSWRSFAVSAGLNEQSSALSEGDKLGDDSETAQIDTTEEPLSRTLAADELKALLADSERRKLIRKLSEANQYNRFLKRQLHIEEAALDRFKNDLAVLELEFQALVSLAEEIANEVPAKSRKINGKYIQSHLLSRLEAVHAKIKEQIEDVDSLKFQEITVFWVGMAESVQVMGSFDGWTEGEELSPEYSGGYARFSTTLKLRPGRYEIKFLVDGEWQLSPEFPTLGEGVMKNNLLVVE